MRFLQRIWIKFSIFIFHFVVPLILFILKVIATFLLATVVTVICYYQINRMFVPYTSISEPLNFLLEQIPENDTSVWPLRNHGYLQANFSLLTPKYLHDILQPGVEYEVTLYIDLADYEVNYEEGMFLACMKVIDKNIDVAWPINYKWTSETASDSYGKCKTTILLHENLINLFGEYVRNFPDFLWTLNKPRTKDMTVTIDEAFEVNMKRMPMTGIVTLLSRRLQIVTSHIEFLPKMSFFARHLYIFACMIFMFVFAFWFALINIVGIFDFLEYNNHSS